jgi:hypothetical protein
MQFRLNEIGDHIFEVFFALRPAESRQSQG